MTKLLYLLSASLGGFVGTAFAQNNAFSTPGAFPIHGSGSSGAGMTAPAVDPLTVVPSSIVPAVSIPASAMSVVIPMSPSMSKPTVMSMSTPTMSKPTTLISVPTIMTKPTTATTTAAMAKTTAANNIITVTVDITIIEIFMGNAAPTMTMAKAPLATGVTHNVTVGGLNNEYVPNFVNAAPGDIVVFTFLEDNHTLTQSTFNTPCMKLAGGFDSGFIPNLNRAANPPPTVKMQVTSTTPLFFYCKQEDHCVADGMVFTINPTANMSEAAFIARAKSFGTTTTTAIAKPTATAMVSTIAATPSIVAGTGTIVNGQCTCACLCGTNAFPQFAGVGAFGGLSGMAPQSALAAVAAMGTPT